MHEEPFDAQSEAQFLANYDMRAFPPVAVTVDVVWLTEIAGHRVVLLIKRGNHPFKGKWALPGGFANDDETLDEGARRELREETSLDALHLEQLGAYGDPGRDPRGHTVTVAYLAVGPPPQTPQGADDAADAQFWRLDDLDLAGDGSASIIDIAFDHRTIICDAIARYNQRSH